MFRRVLVANRGEIARRIIRTLNEMNIESVCIYSEADKDAIYLKEVFDKVCIGPAAVKDSYLCEDAILQAALQTDCEAIHPGFGFLSENARFAARCIQQKLTFIGPAPETISLMGDKAKARSTMAKLSVPTLFGSQGVVGNIEDAKSQCIQIGFPVLLKARAGGGGKGMRLVRDAENLPEAFTQAQMEAQSAFGDGELYIEKFINNARHIEFQILGDHYGNIVCLGERECSIQRKNQKLIEEAPANGFDDKLRNKMAGILKKALKEIGYTNAGTVEFLMDEEENLYFMEMNTRIQVEHPVTELVYGLDLVEWQLRIACLERIDFSDEDLKPKGFAIECRINAEDPANDFSPSPGKIERLIFPNSNRSGPVRIDTHIEEGFKVAPYYDSMLAKIIIWEKNRPDAVSLMKETLKSIHIDGIKTTIDFQRAIMQNEDFVSGNYDCSFIDKNMTSLLQKLG